MPLKCRLIEEVGTRAWLRVYWGEDCPRVATDGRKFNSYHNGMTFLADTDQLRDWSLGGLKSDYPKDRWPISCEHCGAEVPSEGEVNYQVFRKKLFNTASGSPEPGDLYWADWYHEIQSDGTIQCFEWNNCTETRGHLHAVCPDGSDWDIDGRASNCTMKDDKTHRCWVRSGEPPNVTVGKKGHTCAAGAGSIAVTGYHGFLRNGSFT